MTKYRKSFILAVRCEHGFPTKIKMAEAVAKVKEAELARRMDTTPQAFNQRMKTGKFKYEELEQMAQAMGAELVVNFRFPDGTEV